jgi:hypothetical protein
MLNKKHILIGGALLCTGNCLFPSTFATEACPHNKGAQAQRIQEKCKNFRALFRSLDEEGLALHKALYPGENIEKDFYIIDEAFNQKVFIMRYGISLLKDGYKMDFAVKVCEAMILLYKEGMEELLPGNIGSVSDVVWAPEYVTMRKRITDKLKEIMGNNGANYECISKWINEQQGGSWTDGSCAVKYFLLQQRVNPNADFNNIYYLNNLFWPEIGKKSKNFFSNSKIKRNIFETPSSYVKRSRQ